MANSDAKLGFRPITMGGKRDYRRVQRVVDSSNTNTMAIGDAYIIEADGNITRATAANVAVNGIIESFEVQAKSGQGPESLDYIPASTAASVIGIEDSDVEFEVQITTVAATDFISGALVDLVPATPDATLRQSRHTVVLAGDQFKLIRLVDRVDNVVGANAKVVVKLLPASVN